MENDIIDSARNLNHIILLRGKIKLMFLYKELILLQSGYNFKFIRTFKVLNNSLRNQKVSFYNVSRPVVFPFY